ncbi:hypothetical protein D9611_009142 [Ephemerocybe angulata]|uniref:RING-type domain-containing protein n=1 Tax=Ephemerocybe angulata TaxID=980116 RepID=A0A8H5FK67_9AGAR|nr:hypothetical protein D9611_009142 [Tulosesus angulatus]
MLVAGPNSACDVCLEAFGCDGKAPCSISCGHVFCVDCLSRVTRPSCPLCRDYFDSRATIKLHLDLDAVRSSPAPNSNVTLSDEEDARRLREEIDNITTTGCTESQVRRLLADGKTFLHSLPKGTFKDLRTQYKMLSHLCDIKTSLRAQKAIIEQTKNESEALQKEKEALEKEKEALKAEIEMRKKDQQNSLKVEEELREHCQRAHEAYTSMINQYNYVAQQWTKLNDEVKRLRMPSNDEAIARSSPPALELDHKKLIGAAVRKQDSILCTPLPEFTSKSLFLQPLPGMEEEDEEEEEVAEESEEDDEEEEEDEDEESSEESDPEPSEKLVASHPKYVPQGKSGPAEVACTSSSHPYSCKCTGYSDFDEFNKRKLSDVAQSARPPAFVDHVKPSLVEGGLNRSAPRYDVRRARSYSNPSTASSRTQSTSRSASRSPSPPVRSPPPNTFGAVYTSPLAQDSRNFHTSPAPKPADGEVLRSRLANLLSADTPSLSQPKSTSHISASTVASRDHRSGSRAERQRSPSPSRSPSPRESGRLRRHSSQVHRSQPSYSQQNTNDHYSKLLASHQPVNTTSPPPSTSPNGRTSSASEAARALEQSKRERQRADNQDRNRRSRDPTQPERETERVRTTSQATASSTHQHTSAASGPLVPYTGPVGATLASRPSTNFNAPSASASSSHRDYVHQQPQSRYNTVSTKGLSSSSMASLHQGLYSS